jgi:SOS response regulatory protein OraA/RecX
MKNLEQEVIHYLIDEGYVNDKSSAEKILESMSQEWLSFILEKKISNKELKAAYLRGRHEGGTEIISNAPIQSYTPKQVLKMSGKKYLDRMINKDAKKAVKAVRKKDS